MGYEPFIFYQNDEVAAHICTAPVFDDGGGTAPVFDDGGYTGIVFATDYSATANLLDPYTAK